MIIKKTGNRLFIFLLIFISFCTATAQSQDRVIDEVLWVVGDAAILKSDVEKQIEQARRENVELPGDPYCTVSEQLAVQKLFLHQSTIDSVAVSDAMVNQQVEMRISELAKRAGSEERLAERLGRPMNEIRGELRKQAREQMKIQQVQRNIVGELKVTPSEVRKFYEKNQSNIPEVPATMEIQILTVEPAFDPQEIEAIKEQLRSYKERVEKGEATFSVLASIYSQDTESAKSGGELGFMGKGQLVPEFAAEAFSLTKPDQVSRVIQSEFGFHLIQLIERRGDKVNVRHILISPKPKENEKTKAIARLDSISENIRSGKITFENAVLMFSQDKNTRNNGGLMANPYDGTSQFENQMLPPEIARMTATMNIGEISKPFVATMAAKEVCAVIKIKSKTAAHKASLTNDYQLLKTALQNSRSAEMLEKWIETKQKETYIHINEGWQNCEFQYPGWIKK